MIDILKMGKKKRIRFEFDCRSCGTVLRADREDLLSLIDDGRNELCAVIICPVCRERVYSSQTVEEVVDNCRENSDYKKHFEKGGRMNE